MNKTRRELLAGISFAGAGALLVACGRGSNQGGGTANQSEPTAGELGPADVTATEDLMREHGVLRRALLVYREAATRLRQDPNSVTPDVLEKTAHLFRVFGEDYHEKKLEEEFVLPLIKKFRNPAEAYVDVLMAQHARGRGLGDGAPPADLEGALVGDDVGIDGAAASAEEAAVHVVDDNQ